MSLAILIYPSGNGTGDGVVRAVLEATIQEIIKDQRYWRSGLDEGYYSLAPRLESSDVRCTQIKAYATLIMVAMFNGLSPDPISPFLLAFISQGESLLYDKGFMATVAPLTRAIFNDWPDNDTIPPNTPHIQCLLAHLDVEVQSSLSLYYLTFSDMKPLAP